MGQSMTIVNDRVFEDANPQGPARLQWFLNLAGAVTSLGLVVGVGVWGYKLAVRDVTGIPVIRALEGPMRIAPQEPGGEIAAHTGLSVNEIAAAGAAAPLPEQMVLAPRPIDLTEEDQPMALAEAAAPPEVETRAALTGITDTVALADPGLPALAPGQLTETPVETVALVAPAASVDGAMATEVLAEPLSAEPAPAALPTEDAVQSSVEDALAEALAGDTALAAAEPAPPGAVLRSPRPERRPEGDGTAEITPVAATVETGPSSTEIDVASLTPGTKMVQLGAFDDEAGARAEWASLQARFGDLIAAKALVLQQAESGGRSFVRLRALGFEDDADARRFCSALLAENATCIPVTYRQ